MGGDHFGRCAPCDAPNRDGLREGRGQPLRPGAQSLSAVTGIRAEPGRGRGRRQPPVGPSSRNGLDLMEDGVLLVGGLSRHSARSRRSPPWGPRRSPSEPGAPLATLSDRIAVGKDADQLGLPRGRLLTTGSGYGSDRGWSPPPRVRDRGRRLSRSTVRCHTGALRRRRGVRGRRAPERPAAARTRRRFCCSRLGSQPASSTCSRRCRNWTRGPSSWTANCSPTSTPSASSTAYGRSLRSGSASGWANA